MSRLRIPLVRLCALLLAIPMASEARIEPLAYGGAGAEWGMQRPTMADGKAKDRWTRRG